MPRARGETIRIKLDKTPTEIRVSGYGGQGVIMTGFIIGRAAALYEGKEAVLTQSFGPEARGGACSAQVIISEKRINYPYVVKPSVLICLSDEAYRRFGEDLGPHGVLLYEADIVKVDVQAVKSWGNWAFGIPATRIAEELGRRVVVNIVMVGFFTAISGLLSVISVRKAIKDLAPPGTEEINREAFEKGYNYGQEILKAVLKK